MARTKNNMATERDSELRRGGHSLQAVVRPRRLTLRQIDAIASAVEVLATQCALADSMRTLRKLMDLDDRLWDEIDEPSKIALTEGLGFSRP